MLSREPADAQDHCSFGLALRRLRHDAGITQQELADRVGIGVEYVSRLENGHRGARWHTVMRLLRALDVTVIDLGKAIERVEREV